MENPRRDAENEQTGTLLERQKEQTLADFDRRNIQKLNEVIQFQRGEISHAHQGDEQHRRDQQLLHEQ